MAILFQVNDNKGRVNRIFDFVANALMQMATALGITYNQINIICYYFLIPLSWAIMIDFYIKKPITSLVVIGVWIIIVACKWRNFSEWCDWLFEKSVKFLLYFDQWGSNYNMTSVIICVILPLCIYGLLAYLLIAK